MTYKRLQDCVNHLDKNQELLIIDDLVDPNLEMASIHLNEFSNGKKAILYQNIKGTKFKAVSNLFGTIDRSRLMFRDTIKNVKSLIKIKTNPKYILKYPLKSLRALVNGVYAIPKKVSFPKSFHEIKLEDLPQIKCWKMDGGAFVTLPQVYTEDPENPGIMNSNLGMYRVQLSGNDYLPNEEVGVHYQIHRGIGVHHQKANKLQKPLKVSIFIGGPPSHTFSAVMPLPEGISEVSFAGVLGKRRFRYAKKDGYTISADADFVICREINTNETKIEGPFGDHLGYYSMQHHFPVMKVKNVYAKKDAIWPFTVVGRPPQEDSQFGKLIHDMTDYALKKEIPGLKELNAVDDAGVHPLLLAVGKERYTPFNKTTQPQEILTIANHILGTGQMSLAKYLFICDDVNVPSVYNEEDFITYLLERVDWQRDLHFYTKTTIDTLDYTGDGLNQGSKVVIAAAGDVKRKLSREIKNIKLPSDFYNFTFVSEGNVVIEGDGRIKDLISYLETCDLSNIGLISLVDNARFSSKNFSNWMWTVFTRSNPAADIYGLNSRNINKHFSCSVPIIDARIKEHHAPILER